MLCVTLMASLHLYVHISLCVSVCACAWDVVKSTDHLDVCFNEPSSFVSMSLHTNESCFQALAHTQCCQVYVIHSVYVI